MTNIVLIENCNVSRNKYIQIINSSPSFKAIGEFENCEKALNEIDILVPDIILIDIAIPGTCGIQGLKYIKRKAPKAKIMVLTAIENAKYVFDTLKSGALGFLLKNSTDDQFLEALKQLSYGGAPMSPQVSKLVVTSFYTKQFDELTERENDVLIVLSKGKSYVNIANELYVSVNTVKKHVRNIYEKLNVNSRDEVINLMQSNYA